MKKINLALQVLPKGKNIDVYKVVDKAIEVIAASGVKYMVCPFETVMEGEYEELMHIVSKAQDACYQADAEEVLVYIKIQRNFTADVFIDDKLQNYGWGLK